MSNTKIWTLWKGEKISEDEAGLLRSVAAVIPIPFDEEGKRDIKTLVSAFLERDDALGLAAPQIGISKKIIAFRTGKLDEKDGSKAKRTTMSLLIRGLLSTGEKMRRCPKDVSPVLR
jgi:N-formylmethionyl-tRNA deformylase